MTRLQIVNWPEAEEALRERMRRIPYGGKADFAEAVGISPTHLSQLISGKRDMTRELAEKIADKLGVRVDYAIQEAK